MDRIDLTSRDFFDVYVKVKNERQLKNKVLPSVKKSKAFKIFSITFGIMLTIALAIFSVFNYFFGNLNTDLYFKKSCKNLGVKTLEKIDNNIINLAVFGVDKRPEDKNGRSDVTMIITLDGLHNKAKMTTLMRDDRLYIENHGKDKLCHAYSYGGASLAVKTINQNFNLDIHDYITVNFSQMANVIDAIGGIDIAITRSEADAINGLLNSTEGFKNKPRVKLPSSKKQLVHLDGAQALNYARIRNIDSDIKRIERQQYVLETIFEKIKHMKKTQMPSFIQKMLKIIETSLTPQDILKFLPLLFKIQINSIEKCKIPNPTDKKVKPGKINGTWYWDFDIKEYSKILHNFIYEKDGSPE